MEAKSNDIEEIVRIELVVPDAIHYSGGPFCAFVNLLPIAAENGAENTSVTVDFISLNLYGVAVYDNKLVSAPKSQNTLHFPFLQAERAELQQNLDLSLIFASDPVVFCTFREFWPRFEELSWDVMAFRYSYYLYINVQYRNAVTSKVTKTVTRKLEFNLLGSFYHDFPLLDWKYYPILPKTGGFDLGNLHKLGEDQCARIIDSYISEKEAPENLYFNFKPVVEDTAQEGAAVEPSSNSLVSRDLDLVWSLWDVFQESGQRPDPYRRILDSFNSIVDEFSNFNDETDFHKIRRHRHWFGNLFPPELHDEESPESVSEMLKVFLKKLELRMCSHYGKKLDEMKETPRGPGPEARVKDEETISFSFDGNKLCTCTINGFKTVEEVEELEIAVDSWFSINLDFTGANRHCLKVQVSLTRVESYPGSTKTFSTNVIEESMISLGKLKGNITSFLSSLVVPSFKFALLDLSYKLEITFFCFEDAVDIFDQNAIKQGLNKLKMVRWTRPVTVVQNEALRAQLDDACDLARPGELKHSRAFAKNKLSTFLASPKSIQLYKIIKI